MDGSQVPESLYLYGRSEFLGKFAGLESLPNYPFGLRFCDILHYKVMENEKVRDDESVRTFFLHRDFFTITVNGITLNAASLADHPKVEVPVPRCFCLCLSTLADSDHMYDKFGADICLRVDVQHILEFLNNVLVAQHEQLQVLHGPIIYYAPVQTSPPPSSDGLIFWKSSNFADESEYRIAIKCPAKYFIADGQEYEVFRADVPSYMQIGHKDPQLWPQVFPEFSLRSARGFQKNRIAYGE